MAIPISDFDEGHMHLAALMHRQGVTRMEISIGEITAVLDHVRANKLQMVVMTNPDGAVIEFLPEGVLDGLNMDGSPEAGGLLN